jgi:hypothetical protein
LAVTEREQLRGARGRSLGGRVLAAVAIAIIVVQLVVVVGALTGAPWWFSWGPNDYLYQYRIEATIAGRALDAVQIKERYGVDADGIYENPIEGLFGIVRSYESNDAGHDPAVVVIWYQLDGGREQIWRWQR